MSETAYCCDDECGWFGSLEDCYIYKHGSPLLCPECKEVVEIEKDDPRGNCPWKCSLDDKHCLCAKGD